MPEATVPEQTKKNQRGRKPKGDRPMTAAERSRASRDRRRFPMEGYSGKQVSVMLSGTAHMALDELMEFFGDKTQKEIVEQAILTMYKSKDLQKPLL